MHDKDRTACKCDHFLRDTAKQQASQSALPTAAKND
jgi:hypothetical protein